MEWMNKMNAAVDYIESHLASNISIEDISKIAGYSSFHFQRMFSFVTDVPISEYIRRRRMTLAAYELQNSDVKIIDLALKYGYNSPNSFARAFENLHGVTPSMARKSEIPLKAFPKMTFELRIQGEKEMDYKIVKEEKFRLFGVSVEVSFDKGKGYEQIEAFVKESWTSGLRERIREAAGYGKESIDNPKLLGVALHSFKEDDSYRFMLTAEYPSEGVSEKFEVLEVPQTTWVVFTTTCKEEEELDTVTKIWKRLPEWFQSTGYELEENMPELERCYRIPNGYKAEVWVPVCIRNK